ncbi:MAG TPA: hypothetical protein VGM05_34010 [Planctomycetaceae bacterium]
MRNRSRRISRVGLAFLVVLCSALARGDSLTPEVRDARRQEIARKSESERARLQRSFKAFRELPQAEQDWLRQFAKELKDDDRGEGKLRSVMNEYYEWLSTLTPGQRDDLRKETDPNRRDKQVRDLLKKQQELADATGAKAGVKAPHGLSADDLDAVLGIVEQAIRNYLAPEEIEHLKKKRGVARHTYILDLAFRPGSGPGSQVMPRWWSKEVLEAMVSAITNPAQQHQLRNKIDQGAKAIILQLMVAGVRAEYETEHEKIKPDQDNLERFFVQLSSTEQDEIMRLPFDQQQKKLLDTYMTKKSLEDPDNFPKPPQFPWLKRLRDQVQAAAQRAGANRPGEPQRSGDGDAARKENPKKKANKGKAKGNKSANDEE